MTDLPRRSYPLVVAPPGGFEDAVRRGRTMRRRRAGGTSGLTLVLVGALGWAVLGGGSGVDRLEQPVTNDSQKERSASTWDGGVVVPASPQPSTTASPRPGTVTQPGTGSYTGVRPSVGPSTTVQTRKPGGTTDPGRRYWPRPLISRDDPVTNTGTSCPLAGGTEWCAYAFGDDSMAAEDQYTLEYNLCRSLNAGDATVRFNWRQQVDFEATDTAHDDTVWKYSAGQARIAESRDVDVPAGTCVRWSVVWNGLDDFGYTPAAGGYTMVARPMATIQLPAAQATFNHV